MTGPPPSPHFFREGRGTESFPLSSCSWARWNADSPSLLTFFFFSGVPHRRRPPRAGRPVKPPVGKKRSRRRRPRPNQPPPLPQHLVFEGSRPFIKWCRCDKCVSLINQSPRLSIDLLREYNGGLRKMKTFPHQQCEMDLTDWSPLVDRDDSCARCSKPTIPRPRRSIALDFRRHLPKACSRMRTEHE